MPSIDTYFTADEHLGHLNIIKLCSRPFELSRVGLETMKETILLNHNMRVSKGGTTYHIGDMFWRTMPEDEAVEYMKVLNGTHHFYWGNHDELMKKSARLRGMFATVGDIGNLNKTEISPKLVLLHYAMRVWHNSHNGSWHLYGHSHGALPDGGNLSMDVGVDTHRFMPYSLAEIAEIMKAKKLKGHEDPIAKEIRERPWDKAEGAQKPKTVMVQGVEFPLLQPPQELFNALKLVHEANESLTGGKCIE